jgi:hypothetical protein
MTKKTRPERAPADDPAKPARGELQRRVRAILDGGADRYLSKASLRAFIRCRQWASFDQCTFKVSLRTLAKSMHGGKSTAERGLNGLVEAGIIVELPEPIAGCRVFEIVVPEAVVPSRAREDRGREMPFE